MMKASSKHESGQAKVWPLFLLFALLLLPFCFLGYGADNDTYGVLDAGRSTWSAHVLRYSRPPGYWAFEAATFFLNNVGGFVATNIASLVFALLTAWRFFCVAVRLRIAYPKLLTACLVAVPVYAVAATTTMDYVWSLLGLVVLVEALLDDRWELAAAGATWAYLIRTANGVVIAGVIAGAMLVVLKSDGLRSSRLLKLLGVGVVALVVGSIPLLLSYKVVHSTEFVHALTDPDVWSLKMRVGRFGYKCILLFGLPAALWLFFWAIKLHGKRAAPDVSVVEIRKKAVPMLLGGVVANVGLFVCFPLEISYLLPAAAFFLLLVGVWFFELSSTFATGLLLLIVLANLVTVQLAKPDVANDASSARIAPAFVKGQLIADAKDRLAVRQCDTLTCWHLMNPQPTKVQLKRHEKAAQ